MQTSLYRISRPCSAMGFDFTERSEKVHAARGPRPPFVALRLPVPLVAAPGPATASLALVRSFEIRPLRRRTDRLCPFSEPSVKLNGDELVAFNRSMRAKSAYTSAGFGASPGAQLVGAPGDDIEVAWWVEVDIGAGGTWAIDQNGRREMKSLKFKP